MKWFNFWWKIKTKDFADWILQVGDGQIDNTDNIIDSNDMDTSFVQIREDLVIHSSTNRISSIFLATYPDFENSFNNFIYLRERAITTPRNTTVSDVNNYIINLVLGEKHVFLSYDSLCSSNSNVENLETMYPIEFLNKL